jgi:hypothetical protein
MPTPRPVTNKPGSRTVHSEPADTRVWMSTPIPINSNPTPTGILGANLCIRRPVIAATTNEVMLSGMKTRPVCTGSRLCTDCSHTETNARLAKAQPFNINAANIIAANDGLRIRVMSSIACGLPFSISTNTTRPTIPTSSDTSVTGSLHPLSLPLIIP